MKKTIPIAQIEEKVRGWTALVQVLDRSHILVSEENPTISCRRFVFVDLDGTRVSTVAYNENIPPSSTHLIPLKKYYVSGATLKKATESDKIGPYHFTWTINHNTFIEPYEDGLVEEMFWPIEYQKFGNLQRFIDTEDLQNIQGLVAHAFDVKEIGLQTISRDIVLVNNERIPIILTLWNTYVANEGYQLASTVSAGNVVLAMRVKVTTLHGLSLSTRAGSSILINPPIPEAAILRQWYLQEQAVVADLVATEAYKNTSVLLPPPHPKDIKIVQTLVSPNNEPGEESEMQTANPKACIQAVAGETMGKDDALASNPLSRNFKNGKNTIGNVDDFHGAECSGTYPTKKIVAEQSIINDKPKKARISK
ncbi:Unknown protein [Striga hermonthica]|uniref:Uncharacterized protein n=1 Tax=Striga hermonthica TaxID=68872 RepID=A0A9N7MJ90_STRHE|nr:Unknown protein [Striga hermonthica]